MGLAASGRRRYLSALNPNPDDAVTSNFLVVMAICAVALALLAGLFNMMRDGSPSLSQKLMRWRVGLQFAAVVIIMGVLYFRH